MRRSVRGGPNNPTIHDGCSHCAGSASAGPWPEQRRHALGESECSVCSHSSPCFRAPTWFISGSNKALATVPFPSGMVGRVLKPQLRAQHEWPGLVTACDHVKRPLGLAFVDEPMAQLHGCEGKGGPPYIKHNACKR